MGKGYFGKILVADLNTAKIREEALDEKIYRDFLGGAGLGARLLMEYQAGGADPLGPENTLGFLPGIFGGTAVPSGSRLTVVAKSPLTGGWGDASVGGHMAYDLKRAGYDGILVKGESPKPVYLVVDNGHAVIRDAESLWGLETAETVDKIDSQVGGRKLRTLCIGPAGEAQSRISAIIAEKERAAGRSGLGAVMGSKRLKAVAVRGGKSVPVADEDRIQELRKRFLEDIKDPKKLFVQGLMGPGTAGSTEILTKIGATPIKNWSLTGPESLPPGSVPYGPALNEYKVGKDTCATCPIGCRGKLRIDDEVHPRPEYETVAGFGPMCLNTNPKAIVEANDICNGYGLDTISTSTVIAFAFECFEKGLITKKDTEGLDLTWGNHEAMLALLKKIAKREGIGHILADGVKQAVERLGPATEACAMHVGGQEPGYHDPRLFPARGTGYMCDPTPGRHTSVFGMIMMEMGQPMGPYSELKPPEVKIRDYGRKIIQYRISGKYEQVFAATGMCKFALMSGSVPLFDAIAAVTGWDITPGELLMTGERIQTMRQLFNIREGIVPANIQLPSRLKQPANTGPLQGIDVDFQTLRRQYYEAMGWDVETGYPKVSRLAELGLDPFSMALKS